MGNTVRVIAAIIIRNARVLLCERPPHKRHGGLWEFPGGKVEPGESDFDAARRELQEELGVAVIAVGAPEYSVMDPGSHFQIDFVRVHIEGEPQGLEHTRLCWADEAELLSFPLAPSDFRFAKFRLGLE
jgi:mutator protein MutT